MKKLLIGMLLIGSLFLNSSCVVKYFGASYETGNYMVMKIKKNTNKNSFKLIVTSQDPKEFEKMTKNIVELFTEWNNDKGIK